MPIPPVQVVSPEDLVPSELAWAKPSHSEAQLRDVRNLERTYGRDFGAATTARIVERLRAG